MVGYDPGGRIHLTPTEHAFAGAISGATTRAVCQPLDVIKIRFQLQVEPLKPTAKSKYYSIPQAVRCIVKEEGIIALWKGHFPAQILSITYGVAQYGTFEFLTQEVWQYLPTTLTTTYRPLTHTVCGGISGCVATAFIHPMDVMRTRFVAQGEPKLYRHLSSAVAEIMRLEGFRGYYRGLVPAVAQIGPQMGLQFGLYTAFVGLWNKSIGILQTSPPASLESLVCGSGSGLIAKMLVHPMDVVKKRLQVQGFEEARRCFGATRHYRGLIHCVRVCLKEEGVRGLYKGLGPSLLKAAAVAGSNFCVYERVCHLLTLRKSRYS